MKLRMYIILYKHISVCSGSDVLFVTHYESWNAARIAASISSGSSSTIITIVRSTKVSEVSTALASPPLGNFLSPTDHTGDRHLLRCATKHSWSWCFFFVQETHLIAWRKLGYIGTVASWAVQTSISRGRLPECNPREATMTTCVPTLCSEDLSYK